TSRFFALSASTMRGRSSSTRSGRTWPLARTGHSMPSQPTSTAACAVFSYERSCRTLVKPPIFQAALSCAKRGEAASAAALPRNVRRVMGFMAGYYTREEATWNRGIPSGGRAPRGEGRLLLLQRLAMEGFVLPAIVELDALVVVDGVGFEPFPDLL